MSLAISVTYFGQASAELIRFARFTRAFPKYLRIALRRASFFTERSRVSRLRTSIDFRFGDSLLIFRCVFGCGIRLLLFRSVGLFSVFELGVRWTNTHFAVRSLSLLR